MFANAVFTSENLSQLCRIGLWCIVQLDALTTNFSFNRRAVEQRNQNGRSHYEYSTLGFGTFRLKEAGQLIDAVTTAFATVTRHIATAQSRNNANGEVGRPSRPCIHVTVVFITTKILELPT